MYKNIFYFRRICRIGGTEQFLYEIAKKYGDSHDITIFFRDVQDNGGYEQLKRLREKVRCIMYTGQKVECEKAFYNFNIEMIDDVEAKEHIFVSHANFDLLHEKLGGYIPPIDHPKLTGIIGVSDFATNKINEFAKRNGIKLRAKTCYNPLMLEEKKKIVRLVAAARLDDEVRGGKRICDLINELDRYCEENGTYYTFEIFSNPLRWQPSSENVVIRKPRLDVRQFIANADYYINIPDDMDTYGYSMNEALGYGVPIVATPLSVLKELPVTENEVIYLDFDCSNLKEVVKQIFEKKVEKFDYKIPKDNWSELLAKGKNTYNKEKRKKVFVRCIHNYYDLELAEHKTIKDEPYEVPYDRALYLQDDRKYVKIL